MKKRVIAKAQKRHRRNKEKVRIEKSESFLDKLLLGKLYPEHSLYRIY